MEKSGRFVVMKPGEAIELNEHGNVKETSEVFSMKNLICCRTEQ